jgi:hypothetical protein
MHSRWEIQEGLCAKFFWGGTWDCQKIKGVPFFVFRCIFMTNFLGPYPLVSTYFSKICFFPSLAKFALSSLILWLWIFSSCHNDLYDCGLDLQISYYKLTGLGEAFLGQREVLYVMFHLCALFNWICTGNESHLNMNLTWALKTI